MKVEQIESVDIVGADLMGHGISRIFGIKGYQLNLYNKEREVLESPPRRFRNNLQLSLRLNLIEKPETFGDGYLQFLDHYFQGE